MVGTEREFVSNFGLADFYCYIFKSLNPQPCTPLQDLRHGGREHGHAGRGLLSTGLGLRVEGSRFRV